MKIERIFLATMLCLVCAAPVLASELRYNLEIKIVYNDDVRSRALQLIDRFAGEYGDADDTEVRIRLLTNGEWETAAEVSYYDITGDATAKIMSSAVRYNSEACTVRIKAGPTLNGDISITTGTSVWTFESVEGSSITVDENGRIIGQ